MDGLTASPPLNEGREVNPDDRPFVRRVRDDLDARSTKVGRLTPTTARRCSSAGSPASALNEGREVNPDDRRHCRRTRGGTGPLNEGREVNPDDRSRCPPPSRGSSPLNEGREVNPDDRPCSVCWPFRTSASLNEGREVNPDDSTPCSLRGATRYSAQRRSGG